ncbi:MAG: hypothetical protein HQL23_02740, partial [Candidatus Omnitrophica bacterium]|nr:hypothetical protein [Candidatus Omnitrophota bacterium]
MGKTAVKAKNLAQQVCFAAGRAVARAKKINNVVPLNKVSDVSKKAWQTTKKSSVKIGAGIKDGAVDIAKSFRAGFHSLKQDHVATLRRVEEILDGPAPVTAAAVDLPRLSGAVLEEDYAGLADADIDYEIAKIANEIKEIDN